jgi:prevent-host-death family protein
MRAVKDISATDAARNFSEVLDAIEHRREEFTVSRNGLPVARISPIAAPSGRAVKDVLLGYRPDPLWAEELASLRSLLVTEERPWND